jgi:hypothetical protein
LHCISFCALQFSFACEALKDRHVLKLLATLIAAGSVYLAKVGSNCFSFLPELGAIDLSLAPLYSQALTFCFHRCLTLLFLQALRAVLTGVGWTGPRFPRQYAAVGD